MSTVHDVRVRHENELLTLPGVVGVADTAEAGRDAIQVFVANDSDRALIPERIEGYPVDVIQTGEIGAQG